MSLTDDQLNELELKANDIRQLIVTALNEAASGHAGGSLGMTDIFTALYFHILNHDPNNPDWPDRDRLILSNGHICPVQYCTLALAGYFPKSELMTIRKINSRLQGHPHRTALPGLETTSGPLGEGLSQSIGMALSANLDKKNFHIFCLTSDGEHQEGNTWEAAMFAGKYKLGNLTQVIDRNNIQIDGHTEDVMPLEPFRAKYEAFNWNVIDIDGHNIKEFIEAVEQAKKVEGKPTIIIAKTVLGKGVSFMEDEPHWHGAAPNDDELKIALKELRDNGQKIKANN